MMRFKVASRPVKTVSFMPLRLFRAMFFSSSCKVQELLIGEEAAYYINLGCSERLARGKIFLQAKMPWAKFVLRDYLTEI